jgi:hypothetical protein
MTSAGFWACPGCGATHSGDDPDLVTGHVQQCDYVDGAGQPVELTVKFSSVNWYIARIRSDRLAAVTGGRRFAALRGPVGGDDDDSGLEELLAELADDAGPAMADGFEVGDVYPAAQDRPSGHPR